MLLLALRDSLFLFAVVSRNLNELIINSYAIMSSLSQRQFCCERRREERKLKVSAEENRINCWMKPAEVRNGALNEPRIVRRLNRLTAHEKALCDDYVTARSEIASGVLLPHQLHQFGYENHFRFRRLWSRSSSARDLDSQLDSEAKTISTKEPA